MKDTAQTAGGSGAEKARSRGWSILQQCAILAGFLLLGFAFCASVWGDPTHRYVGVGGDPIQTATFMAYTVFAMTHGHMPLFSGWFNAPAGVNMMWNTSVIAVSVLLTPVLLLAGGIAAYNVALALGIALSGWAAYLFARRLGGGLAGSLCAGLLYGYSPYMVGQSLGHLNLVIVIFPPLVGLLTYDLVVVQTRAAWQVGILLGLAIAIQVYISEEVAATTVLVALGIVLVIGIDAASRLPLPTVKAHARHALRGALLAAGMAIVLAGPAIIFQFFGPDVVARVVQLPEVFNPLALILPTTNELLAPRSVANLPAVLPVNYAEDDVYLGIPLMAFLLAGGWVLRRDRRILILAGSAVVIAVIALGWGWSELSSVPILRDVLPNRLSVYTVLLGGSALAVAMGSVRSRRGSLALTIAALLSLACFIPALPRPVTTLDVPVRLPAAVARAVPPGSVVAFAPYATTYQPLDMQYLVNDSYRFRLVGGYAYVPLRLGCPATQLKALTRASRLVINPSVSEVATVRSLLEKLQVRAVIDPPTVAFLGYPFSQTVRPIPAEHALATAFYTTVLGQPAVSTQGFLLWIVPKAPRSSAAC